MRPILSFILLFLAITSCSTEPKNLTIAAAASVQYPMEELKEAFTQQTSIPCDLIVGSSGKLTAQIKEGAPYDVFVSADYFYPEQLYKNGLATDAPKIYGTGQLVLWSFNKNIPPYVDSLTNDQIKKIAIANPKTAPYGKATMQVLDKKGLSDKINSKLVYGESIGQTNQFITSKSADIGFTAKSVVLSNSIKNKGNWTLVNPTDYEPIKQAAILIKRDQEPNRVAEAQQFYDFLFSEQGKKILSKYGY